jgi:hypothetical protein
MTTLVATHSLDDRVEGWPVIAPLLSCNAGCTSLHRLCADHAKEGDPDV